MSSLADRIRPDAIQTLAGAGYVRERLVSILHTGPDNLGDIAYAVKCRIKSEESLINKVIYKRRVEGKTQYSPGTATDIIGLRLLALTNEQMPTLCRKFVSLISLAQHPNISLFVGQRLDDAIIEIKVYKSSVNPVVYDEIHAYFTSLDINAKKITLNEATPQDPYSSVHIVALTNSYSRRTSRHVPIEVQIRTVFEDAWAEIDHPLRYKGRSYHQTIKSTSYERFRKIADGFLTVFKDDIDTALKQADKIQSLYAELFDSFFRQTYSKIRHTPFGPRLEYRSLLQGHLPHAFRGKLQSIDKLMGTLGESMPKIRAGDKLAENIDSLLHKLNQLIHVFESNSKTKRKLRSLVGWIKMDKALLLVWKSRALITKKRNAILVRDCLKAALEIYLELDRDDQFSKETLLKFRVASVFVLNNDYETALEKLREAYSLLAKDTRIPKVHILRISIPRQYSYLLWRSKQDIWSLGALHNNLDYRIHDQIGILRQCKAIIDDCIKGLKGMKESEDIRLETIKVWNNFIAICWELRDLGQQVPLNSKQIESIKDTIEKIEEHVPRHTRKLSGLDTALKGADLANDVSSKARLLKIVERELRKQRRSQIEPEGYTTDELDFVEYCLRKIRDRRSPADRSALRVRQIVSA